MLNVLQTNFLYCPPYGFTKPEFIPVIKKPENQIWIDEMLRRIIHRNNILQ